MVESYLFDIRTEQDLPQLMQCIREDGRSYGFARLDIEQFVLGVSEIGTNTVRHGGGGEATFSILKKGGVMRVVFDDNGPGISNIGQAKIEGFSTINNSLGIGLVVAQRSVDYLSIDSTPDSGTSITLEKHRPISPEVVDYGLVSIADAKYDFNGDQYLIKEYGGDSLLIGMIDGPGQGYDAYSIATSCKTYIEEHYLDPIDKILRDLDLMMNESRDIVGVTASIMRVTPGKMTYKGYGDTHAYLVKDGVYHALINQGGRLGNLKKYRPGVGEFVFDKKLQVILCTDGISVLPKRQALRGTAQQVANVLFDDHHKPHGDASVLSVKYLN